MNRVSEETKESTEKNGGIPRRFDGGKNDWITEWMDDLSFPFWFGH